MTLRHSILAAALLATGLVAALPPAPRASAAPEPAAAPQSWQLDIKVSPPERLIVTPDNKLAKQTYWYFRYTVTNNSGQDVMFTPQIELLTDTGQILTVNKGVDHSVFQKVKALYKAQFMEDPLMVVGKILQGDDNAKDGLAIFTGLDPDARNFRLAITGLSGEIAEVLSPITKEKVVLHKTLLLEFDLPGEAINIDPQPQFKSKKWVMK